MASELSKFEPGEIPLKLLKRIDNPIVKSRIEHSRYGPFDKLLNIIFWGPDWLVKPQAPLYEEASTLEEAQADEFGAKAKDSKTDSYGKMKAKGARATFPDFVVCTYTDSAYEDVPVLVLEVKREGVPKTSAIIALTGYLEKLGGNVRGFLVTENLVEEVQRQSWDQTNEDELIQSMRITSEEFLDCLRDIALG